MLNEHGLDKSPIERDRLASDEPNDRLLLPTWTPGSGWRTGGICRHLYTHKLLICLLSSHEDGLKNQTKPSNCRQLKSTTCASIWI